ncbi:MAG: hypothetical protein GVY20_07060 [Bacteroidetes bacterium]|jgi:hypothetical protein|nr:hypothetical protein [Bacteroidota bacterium]
MKSKLYFLLSVLLILGFISISCEGPEGPMGPQGEQGPPGPVGPAGEGTNIHAGEGSPDGAMGEPGDFYLDLTSGDLYGPKDEADGWGDPVSLSGSDGQDGEDGEDGQDGSQIYAGEGVPQNDLGKEGDYYLNKSTFDLYGPKTESGWGDPINLQGPPGEDGTANVMYSDWLNIEWNGVDNPTIKIMVIDEPLLTEDYFDDGGTLLMYFRMAITGGHVIYPIPFKNGNDYLFYGFVNVPGTAIELQFAVESIDGTTAVGDYMDDQVRYILIPDGVPAKMPSNFFDDYNKTINYLGVPE